MMETTLKQKVGIALSLIGGLLALGFNWIGPSAVVVGIFIAIIGLILAFRENSKENETKWLHDNTHAGDD